ncbi:DUF805 domain-containing protein [Asticcacaulis solisilvae]|uniref:DUF805 domain-containing protein n=1 Tax=Asticcacaulis solisilvae TaxID=1217274 RepID=UPI003FD74309
MPESVNAFLSLLISPRRMSRRLYLLFVMLVNIYLFLDFRLEPETPPDWLDTLLRTLFMFLFALRLHWATRRLHDIGVTAYLAAPVALVLGAGIVGNTASFLNLDPPAIFNQPSPIAYHGMTNGVFGILIILAVVLLEELALMIIPGNKGPNRFGPPPGAKPPKPADLF